MYRVWIRNRFDIQSEMHMLYTFTFVGMDGGGGKRTLSDKTFIHAIYQIQYRISVGVCVARFTDGASITNASQQQNKWKYMRVHK